MQKHKEIVPSVVRFIRLGPGNRWAEACVRDSRIVLGHREVPHELAKVDDWDGVRLKEKGRSKAMATSTLRETKEFYMLGADCLWVTFWNGRLWWAFAEPNVFLVPGDADRDGARYRRVIGQWQSTDIFGRLLLIDRLPDDLTKTRRHRRTVCRVPHEDYAISAINGAAA